MYEVTVAGGFTAAHRHAAGHGGPGALHGHDFRVRAAVAGDELEDDVLVDFHALERALAGVLSELGHRELGSLPAFADREPTPAALARWIHERLAPLVAAGPRLRLAWVEVRDTDRSGAVYRS